MKVSLLLTTTVFAFATLFHACSAALCPLTSEGFSGLDTEYSLTELGKLSVLDFSTTVTYATLPAGSSPYVKILAASEQPAVYVDDDGVLTVSPEACDAGPDDTPSPVESPIDPTATAVPTVATSPPTLTPSSSGLKTFSFLSLLLSTMSWTVMMPTRISATLTAFTLLASATWVHGAGHEAVPCKPTLFIEVGVPVMAPVTEKYGETDHYLEATVDTVVWGYYDPNATAATAPVTMASGETITVEVITHHSGHDYAKMIRGDPNIEQVFYWEANQTALNKPEPKKPGSGVHLITGPIAVEGAVPGDVVQIDILELDPRYNPETGRCFGTNSQKFAGYHFRLGEKRDGTKYTRAGGTEAITVFEFLEDGDGNMLYGSPVYMYRWPNLTIANGDNVTFDGNPAVVVPHEYNVGYNGALLESEPIVYPEGFNDISVIDEGGIVYLSPGEAELAWKIPLRPHLGTLGVMPSNTANYIDEDATGGASTIPPSRFGGNVDDFRIGKGGTMYYRCELDGCLIVAGDTHAAQGDSELAGTAMETSMTAKLRVTLHKQGEQDAFLTGVDWPLLETSDEWVVHGFAYANYLDELPDPSTIFADGTSIDAAMEDCFIKTRNWLMDAWGLIEEETIALMTTSIDFGVTQVVDGNWGAHAVVPKFVFDKSDAPYDYSCHTSKTAGRRDLKESRHLQDNERRALYKEHAKTKLPFEKYVNQFYHKVTKSCESCGDSSMSSLLANKLLDAKLVVLSKRIEE